MRKKKILNRLTGATLVLSMLSLASLSGTLAKYTSTVTASDTAKVASFAFTLQDQGTGGSSLNQSSTTAPVTFSIFKTAASDSGVHNPTGGGNTLIAPGVAGTFGFSFTNTSDVAVNTSYSFVLTDDTPTTGTGVGIKVPLVVKFGNDYYSDGLTGTVTLRSATGSATGGDSTTTGTIKGKITGTGANDLSDNVTKLVTGYGPNISGSASPTKDYSFDWFWAFEGQDKDLGTATINKQSNKSDTDFGTATVKLEPKLTITLTVNQLDNFVKTTTTVPST